MVPFCKTKMTVLFIGAHPDDIEISCGGFVFVLKNDYGAIIHKIICTNGERNGDPKTRMSEQRKVDELTGVQSTRFLNIKDGHLKNSFQLVSKIEEEISTIKPDVILCHSLSDHHDDHQSVFRATIAAARNSNAMIIEYPPLNSRANFKANMYVDITNYISKKVEAISTFNSQGDNWYTSEKTIRIRAENVGLDARCGFAEEYKVNLLII